MHKTFPIMAGLLLIGATMLNGCGDGNDNDTNDNGGPTSTPVVGLTATKTATPAPEVTPTATEFSGETPTPIATTTTAPTVTGMPSGNACQAGDQIVVIESLDKAYGAARTDLTYPASVNIPGSGSGTSVTERVVFANTGGITASNDDDKDGDSIDETLTTSTLASADQPTGKFVTVTFDCVTGQVVPAASAFACTVVSASTGGGVSIPDEHCSLSVTGP